MHWPSLHVNSFARHAKVEMWIDKVQFERQNFVVQDNLNIILILGRKQLEKQHANQDALNDSKVLLKIYKIRKLCLIYYIFIFFSQKYCETKKKFVLFLTISISRQKSCLVYCDVRTKSVCKNVNIEQAFTKLGTLFFFRNLQTKKHLVVWRSIIYSFYYK